MHRKELVRFAKVLTYVLAIRPDEFGLVPDQDGYVAIKEILQALREESDWSFIGRGHLMELMHSQERERFEIHKERIRATAPMNPLALEPWDPPPSRLYHGIRRRAHPVVLRHGLKPSKGPWVIMAVQRELALRIGKRRNQDPVILEILAQEATSGGVRFYRTQGQLALAPFVPPEFLVGPALSVEEPKRGPPKPRPKKPVELPGSFYLDLQGPPFERKGTRRRDKEATRGHRKGWKGRRERGSGKK